jgi:hypothetical protein
MRASTGVSEQKLDVLSAWEEADCLFTERERAARVFSDRELFAGDRDGGDHQCVEPDQRRGPRTTAHPMSSASPN